MHLVTRCCLEGPVHSLVCVNVDGDAGLALDSGFLARCGERVGRKLVEAGDDSLRLVVAEVFQLDSGGTQRLEGGQDALGQVFGWGGEEQLVAFAALVVGAVVVHPRASRLPVGGVCVVAGAVTNRPVVVGLVGGFAVVLPVLGDELVNARRSGCNDGLDTAVLAGCEPVLVAGRGDGEEADLTDRARMRGCGVIPVERFPLTNKYLVGPHATVDRFVVMANGLNVPEVLVVRVLVVQVDVGHVVHLEDAIVLGVVGGHAALPCRHIGDGPVLIEDVFGLLSEEVVPQVLSLLHVDVEHVGREGWRVVSRHGFGVRCLLDGGSGDEAHCCNGGNCERSNCPPQLGRLSGHICSFWLMFPEQSYHFPHADLLLTLGACRRGRGCPA